MTATDPDPDSRDADGSDAGGSDIDGRDADGSDANVRDIKGRNADGSHADGRDINGRNADGSHADGRDIDDRDASTARARFAGARASGAQLPGARPSRTRTWSTGLRRPDVAIPAALVALFLILLVLVAARPTPLTTADEWIRTHVQRSARIHSPTPHRWPPVKLVADLGGAIPALPALALSAAVAAWLRRSLRPLYAAAFAYAVLAGAVLVLKATVNRPGPGQATLPPHDLGFFPSGHTANTLMCFGTCALLLATAARATPALRTAIAWLFGLLALAVGASLVWLDYHWTSDVLGSYALCGAALFGVAAILGFHGPTWRRDPSAAPH